MTIVLDLGIEASEIEAIEDVLFIYLTEIFIALGGEEPGDPGVGVVRF